MDDSFQRERLHSAAQSGDLIAVQGFLDQGCPVNAFDELGNTPLHCAVRGECFEVVRLLLRYGADVNAHDERVIGNTPLAEAAPTCSLQMARLLVEAGPTRRFEGGCSSTPWTRPSGENDKERSGREV